MSNIIQLAPGLTIEKPTARNSVYLAYSLDGYIAYHDAQDPAVHEEEAQRGQPQARDESADAEELKLVPLLQPEGLGADPEPEGREAEELAAQEGRARQVDGEEDQIP